MFQWPEQLGQAAPVERLGQRVGGPEDTGVHAGGDGAPAQRLPHPVGARAHAAPLPGLRGHFARLPDVVTMVVDASGRHEQSVKLPMNSSDM